MGKKGLGRKAEANLGVSLEGEAVGLERAGHWRVREILGTRFRNVECSRVYGQDQGEEKLGVQN